MTNTHSGRIRGPGRVFFGWWLAIGSGILCLWGYGYQAYGFSALFKPISQELALSRATTSIAASIGRFEGGIEGPIVGYFADRKGPRLVVLVGVFLLGLGLLLMSRINSLWSFYLVWGLITSMGANIALSTPLDTAIANWFVKQRGKAMSIRWIFSGLSGTIMLPLIAGFVVKYGWRTACAIGGITMWAIGFPIAWFLIKPRRPEYYGLMPDGARGREDPGNDIQAGMDYAAQTGELEFTLGQAMRTKAFWLIIVAYMFHGSLTYVMSIHMVPYLTDRGLDPVVAATTMSIYITASIPSRLLGGILADRVGVRGVRYLIATAYFIQAGGVGLFLISQAMPVLYTFFVLYGLGMGLAMPLTPLLRARYYGRKAYGSIYGVSSLLYMPAGVAGPVLAGWIYDVTNSYMLVFTLLAIVLAVSAIAIFLATPPRPPKRVSGISDLV